MTTEIAIDWIETGALSELEKTVGDAPNVDLVASSGNEVTLRGDYDDVRTVVLSLRTRELSARDHGQDSIANLSASARRSVKRAI